MVSCLSQGTIKHLKLTTIENSNEAIIERTASNIRTEILHTINNSTNASTDDAYADDDEDNDGHNFDKTKPNPATNVSIASYAVTHITL
jgi:hypothetical protein